MNAAHLPPPVARRRRPGTGNLAARRVSVNCGVELGRQLDDMAERFGVAVGVAARYAIEQGIKSARRRLARETGR